MADDYRPQASMTGAARQGHEANFVVVKGLAVFAVVLVAVGTLIELGVAHVMRDFSREEKSLKALAPPGFADDQGPFPAPRLQAGPAADLARMKAEELLRLNEYGWVDRDKGIARVPIGRAIEIVVSKGVSAAGGAGEKGAGSPPAGKPAGPQARRDGQP